jgi:hypothetical protein
MTDVSAGVATAERPGCADLVGGRTTADQIAELRLVWAMTGFPCALRAIRELERRESEAEAERSVVPVPAD